MQSSQFKLQQRLGHAGTGVFMPLLATSVGEQPPLADVKLVTAQGDVVWAHRCVLAARSRYFGSLLSPSQQLHELPSLPVQASAVLAMLRFLYTDTVHFDIGDVQALRELFFLARKWRLFALEVLFGKNMTSVSTGADGGGVRVQSIWQDMRDCLKECTRDSCDVVLRVGQTEFFAHRAVLVCQSDFFRSLFTAGWRESGPSDGPRTVEIGNVSASDFSAVLHFAYSRTFPHSHETLAALLPLLPVASYFSFAALSEGVSSFAARVVAVEHNNVASLFDMASASHFDELLARCVEFATDEFEAMPSHAFVRLPRDLLRRVLDSGELEVDEAIIVARLVRWGYHQLGRAQLADVSHVRIASDDALLATLQGLLPPSVVLSRRNKRALLGCNPFMMQELLV